MKKVTTPQVLVSLLVLVLVGQSTLLAIGFKKIHTLETTKPSVLSQDQQNLSATTMTALSAVSMSEPVVSVGDNKVYLPYLRIALPIDSTSLQLLYSARSVGENSFTYDVTTRGLASLSPIGFQTRLACTPLRLAFEAKPNPYNPHESNNASVKLADGRTLQIYADSDTTCDAQWRAAGVDPDVMKTTFVQAQSY